LENRTDIHGQGNPQYQDYGAIFALYVFSDNKLYCTKKH